MSIENGGPEGRPTAPIAAAHHEIKCPVQVPGNKIVDTVLPITLTPAATGNKQESPGQPPALAATPPPEPWWKRAGRWCGHVTVDVVGAVTAHLIAQWLIALWERANSTNIIA